MTGMSFLLSDFVMIAIFDAFFLVQSPRHEHDE